MLVPSTRLEDNMHQRRRAIITRRGTHKVPLEAVLETFTTDLRGLVARAQGGEVVHDGRGLRARASTRRIRAVR